MTQFLALLGVVAISFSAIFVRLAGVSPATAAFFRTAYALPVLLLIQYVGRPDQRKTAARWMAFVSGVFLALDLSFWHRSIALIGAGLATVLANTQVLFVGLLAWVLAGERPHRRAFIMVPVVFGGAALISGLGRPDAFGTEPVKGTILGVLAGMTYAAFLFIFRASNRGLAPTAGPLLDATVGATTATTALGFLDGQLVLGFTWPAHGWLMALAMGSQVMGWLLVARALPRLPALETSVMLVLQPMLTVFWAWIIFTEQLATVQWSGVLLVLAGVGYLSVRGSVRENETGARVQR